MTEHCYTDCLLCCLSLMLSVTYKPFMLSVVMLSVVMLSVVILSVVMNVVMLSDVTLNVTHTPFQLSVTLNDVMLSIVKRVSPFKSSLLVIRNIKHT
jgi:hypothetical protein